jgi:hypothetical protein
MEIHIENLQGNHEKDVISWNEVRSYPKQVVQREAWRG